MIRCGDGIHNGYSMWVYFHIYLYSFAVEVEDEPIEWIDKEFTIQSVICYVIHKKTTSNRLLW